MDYMIQIVNFTILICCKQIKWRQILSMMKYLLWILCCIVISAQIKQITKQILNKGQILRVSLEPYLKYANTSQIDHDKGTSDIDVRFEIDILDALKNISAVSAQFLTPDGSTRRLSDFQIIGVKEVYNQPLKLFLLKGNFLLLYFNRDLSFQKTFSQFIFTDLNSYFSNPTNIICSQMEIVNSQKGYSILITCKTRINTRIIWLSMDEDQFGFIDHCTWIGNTTYIIPFPLPRNSQEYEDIQRECTNQDAQCSEKLWGAKQCSSYSIKYFDNLTMNLFARSKKALLYCKDFKSEALAEITLNWARPAIIYKSLELSSAIECMNNASLIIEYDSGFIMTNYTPYSKTPPQLYQFYQQNCQRLISIQGYKFITVQTNNKEYATIYVINDTHIKIKRSYSKNFQTAKIDNQGNSLNSYAISRDYLYLYYVNKSNAVLVLIYTLLEATLRLVHIFSEENRLIHATIFSVNNYLEKASYYYLYDRDENLLTLFRYQGYKIEIEVKDSQIAIGNNDLYIKTTNWQGKIYEWLQIIIIVRNYSDRSVTVKEETEILNFDSQIFKVSLNDRYVIGPMAKFYGMKNKDARIQFINQYQQIKLKDDIFLNGYKLIDASINTQVQQTILTFYHYGDYNLQVRACSLEFNKEKMQFQINNCIRSSSINTFVNVPKEILVVIFERFIIYDNLNIEICSTVAGSTCENIFNASTYAYIIQTVQLISYNRKYNGQEIVELAIISQSRIIVATFTKSAQPQSKFSYNMQFQVNMTGIHQLLTMTIKDVIFDDGFSKFIIMHLIQELPNNFTDHLILSYDRPASDHNEKFFAHSINPRIQSDSIQTILYAKCQSDNFLIVIYISDNGTSCIEEYLITDSYDLLQTRKYPLYDRIIVKNGNHISDQFNLFIQVKPIVDPKSQTNTQYLVYSPCLPTANVLSYVLKSSTNDFINFIHKTGPLVRNDNSIAMIGKNLFTLCQPQIVFEADDRLSGNIRKVNMSVVDSRNYLQILQIPYNIDKNSYMISYKNQKSEIILNENTNIGEFRLNSSSIKGPVMSYQFNGDNCDFLEIEQMDIFTKNKCLRYHNKDMYGIMFDIATIEINGTFFQVIVTDSFFVCIKNRNITKPFNRSKVASECKMTHKERNRIFVVCVVNFKSQIQIVEINNDCNDLSSISIIPNPQWLEYQYYNLKYQQPYLLFEVPIEEDEKIYFLSVYDKDNKNISSNYTMLVDNQTIDRQQFNTIDFSMGNGYIYLLENGIYIFKTSIQSPVLRPIKHFDPVAIQYQTQISEPYVFIDAIVNSQLLGRQQKLFQLSTLTNSYQLYYDNENNRLQKRYTYLQMSHCYNTLRSKSRSYRHLVVKLCVLQPQYYGIFGGFIRINQIQKISYIQIYVKSSQINFSYPFRMEDVYSDIYQLNQGYLSVGSIFNFLCFYGLQTEVVWKLSVNSKRLSDKLSSQSIVSSCTVDIILRNVNYQYRHKLQVYSKQIQVEDEPWKEWIHRTVIFVMIINFFRMRRKHIQISKLKKKISGNIFSNEFQVGVKITSKKNIDIN